jgi:hypothetical protein
MEPNEHGNLPSNRVERIKRSEEKRRAYKNNPDTALRAILTSIKARARLKDLDFDLTIEDIRPPEVCPILGIPLHRAGCRDGTPSVDRIDNTKGYTKDNIWVISNKANTMKNNATLQELATFCKRMQETILKDLAN